MARFLVTVLDLKREPPAIAVLYCGRKLVEVERSIRIARQRRMFQGKTVRILISDDECRVSDIRDIPI